MKGRAMQNNETTSAPVFSRRLILIGFGSTLALAAGAGIWFSAQQTTKPRTSQHEPMSATAETLSSSSDDSTNSDTTKSDLQVELGPDDLKKAQVQTVRVGVTETARTLRVPGIVNPDQYK